MTRIGQRGSRKAIIARARQFRGEQTAAEEAAWELLRNRRCLGLKFRRQWPLSGFIADFYCPQLKLVIELDGAVHATDERVIQDRYRKVPALDPRRQEMQKEVAALYGRHGMSMSTQMTVGCLPILLTMPFLIAFYRVLSVSIELRGASFLWIPDLSQRDPLFVTPVLMGISMFVMQRMTPTAMDPAQQRIMMIMPVVLVVMFHAAPAGLNLYWLSSNLCSVVQQAVTLRIIASHGERAQRKERRR